MPSAERGMDAGRARGDRRARGVYFTPPPLAAAAARLLAQTYLDLNPEVTAATAAPLRVADLAAGDGRLLAAAAAAIGNEARARGMDQASAERLSASLVCVGVERDPEAVSRLRKTLSARSTTAQILEGDALMDVATRLEPVDLILGNPPFVRSARLRQVDQAYWENLRGRFAATEHREWDLYGAFIEASYRLLRTNGVAVLIVPSRWMTAAFAAPLRSLLATERAVHRVVDFGPQQLFAGATTYISLLVLAKSIAPVVKVSRFVGGKWQVGALEASSLGRSPWRLTVGRQKSFLDSIASQGPALSSQVEVRKGTGTNADRVFVLTESDPAGPATIRARSKIGGSAVRVEVEIASTRVCYRGRDVRGFDDERGSVRLITPYTEDGALIPRQQFAAKFPLAHAYLEQHRETLQARENGAFRDDGFHRFGRPQNLAWLQLPAPKVVIPDVFNRARAKIDRDCALVLDSAYAMRPWDADSAYSVEFLMGLFNSPIINRWLEQTGLVLRGTYLRMKTRYLADLPLPSAEAARAVSAAVALADRERVVRAVADAYQITESELDATER